MFLYMQVQLLDSSLSTSRVQRRERKGEKESDLAMSFHVFHGYDRWLGKKSNFLFSLCFPAVSRVWRVLPSVVYTVVNDVNFFSQL